MTTDTKKVLATLEWSSAYDPTPVKLEVFTSTYSDGNLAILAVVADKIGRAHV